MVQESMCPAFCMSVKERKKEMKKSFMQAGETKQQVLTSHILKKVSIKLALMLVRTTEKYNSNLNIIYQHKNTFHKI